jgi:hypothetical protein
MVYSRMSGRKEERKESERRKDADRKKENDRKKESDRKKEGEKKKRVSSPQSTDLTDEFVMKQIDDLCASMKGKTDQLALAMVEARVPGVLDCQEESATGVQGLPPTSDVAEGRLKIWNNIALIKYIRRSCVAFCIRSHH